LLNNSALIYGVLTWFTAQGLKVLILYVREHRVDLRLLTAAGGMPSSHSALVCSIAVAIAFREGLDSPLFALAAGVAGVVMYDAAGIRRAAGHHASVLNQIIDELFQGHPINDEKLKELLGHTPTQVFFGALLGILCTGLGMRFVWSGL
jgi:acid phosphatase family membrane protein YuiD